MHLAPRFVRLQPLFTFFLVAQVVHGAITQQVCDDYNECISLRVGSTTWCYYPDPSWPTTGAACAPAAAQMSPVLAVHIAQANHSLAYYDLNLAFLGDTSFPVPLNSRIFFCYSGQTTLGAYQTTCDFVSADNTFGVSPYCSVSIGQIAVGDRCYTLDASPEARSVAAQAQTVRPSSTTGVPASSAPTQTAGVRTITTSAPARSDVPPPAVTAPISGSAISVTMEISFVFGVLVLLISLVFDYCL